MCALTVNMLKFAFASLAELRYWALVMLSQSARVENALVMFELNDDGLGGRCVESVADSSLRFWRSKSLSYIRAIDGRGQCCEFVCLGIKRIV